MKQEDFAQMLGVTPTSVYRYEKALSKPDPSVLETLWVEAQGREMQWAQAAFFEAIRERFGRGVPVTYQPDKSRDWEWPIAGIMENGRWLLEQDNLLILALSNAIRSDELDETGLGVIRTVLKRWIDDARQQRESYLKEHGRSEEIDAEAKIIGSLRPGSRKKTRQK